MLLLLTDQVGRYPRPSLTPGIEYRYEILRLPYVKAGY